MCKNMKKTLLIVLFVLAYIINLSAQETLASKNYTFIYIAHDVTTPIDRLSEKLREAYREAVQYENVAIFYMSNGSDPIIVKVLPNGDDNRDDFEKVLMTELQEMNSHDVDSEIDAEAIVDLLSETDFANYDRINYAYALVNLDFYIGSMFWTLGNNENIISRVYFALDINKFKYQNLAFNVYCNEEDFSSLNYEEGKPFGEKNLSSINNDITILPY